MEDLVLKNGNIISMDNDLNKYDWVSITNKKISGVGKGDAPQGKEEIDLKGKTVLPGLADCHVHTLTTGIVMSGVDLLNATSLDEALGLVEERCKETDGDGWVFAVNFVPHSLKECRYPDRWEIDKISHGHKVIFLAATLHGFSANTKAIEYCDVPLDTAGVEFIDGKQTGRYMSDESAFLGMANVLGSFSDEQLWELIELCVNDSVTKGVTTMHGLLGQMVTGDRDMYLIHDNLDKLPLTMVEYFQTWDVEKVKELGLPRIGGCLTLDGALFEYTMANYKPFDSAPALRGFLLHNDDEVYQLISKAHREGLQCSLHALGERAIDQLIYIYHRVISEQGPKDIRHRIEHFCLPTEEQIQMAADLDLVLSMQVGYTYYWDKAEGGEFEIALGRERSNRWDPYPAIFEAGCMVCGGSDAPVCTVDPLRDIAGLVNNPNPIRNIDVTTALKMYTVNAAYTARLEDTKGSIEVGKDGDLVVINNDPYKIYDKPEVHDLKSLMTVWQGDIVYRDM